MRSSIDFIFLSIFLLFDLRYSHALLFFDSGYFKTNTMPPPVDGSHLCSVLIHLASLVGTESTSSRVEESAGVIFEIKGTVHVLNKRP